MNDVTPGRALAEIKRAPLVVHDQSVFLDTAKFEQMQRYATLMSTAKLVPTHLQNSPGDCFMICQQADRWNFDPFAVAQKTHIVQGKLGYEAQLIAAVINTRAPLTTRLNVRYEGEGDNLVCIAFATMEGEDAPREKRSPRIADIKVKNSPLWSVDPSQQLAYWTQRAWARLHCPDVLLGVYTEDELAGYVPYAGQTIEHVAYAPDMTQRPTVASANIVEAAPAPEPVAEMVNPYPLVDQAGKEESRHATPDQWAKELKSAAAPIEGKLQAKAQAYLRNNAEAYQSLKDEITDDAVVTYLDKLYAAIAGAKKTPPPAAAVAETPSAPAAMEMPVKGGKADGNAYSAMFVAALGALTAKEQIPELLARETDNLGKILPGARRSLRSTACLERWVALGGKQEEFQTS